MACRLSLSIVLLLIQSWLISGHPTAPPKIKVELSAPKVDTNADATAKLSGATEMQTSPLNPNLAVDTLQQLSQTPEQLYADNRNNMQKLMKHSSNLALDPAKNFLGAYGINPEPLDRFQQAMQRTASSSLDNSAGLAFTTLQMPFSMTRSVMDKLPVKLPFFS